jgi:hypothetical protein
MSVLQCAPCRRFSGQFLRRRFSSSATRLEIRDVGALSQRLIPRYQGLYLRLEERSSDTKLLYLD